MRFAYSQQTIVNVYQIMFVNSLFFLFRYDWYSMGNFMVISVYAKLSDPEQTFVEANRTAVSRDFAVTLQFDSLLCNLKESAIE